MLPDHPPKCRAPFLCRYSNSPITSRWIRPELRANASGFYANLLAVRAYWRTTIAAEGMMELDLPAGLISCHPCNLPQMPHACNLRHANAILNGH